MPTPSIFIILRVLSEELHTEKIFFSALLQACFTNPGYDSISKKSRRSFRARIFELFFASLSIKAVNCEVSYLGLERSEKLYEHMRQYGYIDNKDKVTEILKQDLMNNCLSIPQEFEDIRQQIISVIRRVAGKLNIKNKDNRGNVTVNKQVYLDPEFKELWDKIKKKDYLQRKL